MNFLQFQRPQNYIGNEWNVIKKNHWRKLKFCLIFPDSYEVGMSNLGLRIIYGLLNSFRGLVCERSFLPGPDLQKYLRKNRRKLFSLESKTALDRFDVLGFNFGYELNIINFLNILALSGIKLFANDRKELIVLGGGAANPEPLADFVDVFFLGEFEAGAEQFYQVLKKYRSKPQRLQALSEINGFYVPSLSQALPERVYVADLNRSFYPLKWLTPHTSIIHDRAQIEIARGCPNQCAFCQARQVYAPYRQKDPEVIIKIIKEIYKNTGYQDFSLLALSVSDYSRIEELINELLPFFKARRIGLSLPSLRVDDLVEKLYQKILPLKKTSLTLAVESANDCLRRKMNKKLDINKLFEAAKVISASKIRRIKTYFMFGLPEESYSDLEAAAKFIDKLHNQTRLSVSVSLNPFIPKPFSLWQNKAMEPLEDLKKKKEFFLGCLNFRRRRDVKISHLEKAVLEAVISRGGRKLSRVIYRAFLSGAGCDTYAGTFNWPLWKEAFNKEGVDYNTYLR